MESPKSILVFSAHAADFVPAVGIVTTDLVQIVSFAIPVSPSLLPRFETNPGRAPPAI